METFSIRDLRDRTGDLVRGAEAGKLALVVRHGRPVFLAVPFDELLVREGIMAALALKLFDMEVVSLGKAARLAEMNREDFIELCATQDVPVVRYPPDELQKELEDLDDELPDR